MGSIDALIFDLDGTLWDTTETCARAWNAVIEHHSIPFRPVTADDVRGVTGRPHRECIEVVFDGLTREQLDLLTRETETGDNVAVREHGGLIYPDVARCLPTLSEHWPLMIVSNCQSGYIDAFLEFSGFRSLFVDHECWGNTGESKSRNLATLMGRNNVVSPVFIGDTTGDERAARDNGVPFIHVTHGFGSAEAPDLAVGGFAQFAELVVMMP